MFATVFAVALVLNFGVGCKLGISRPLESDAYYYLQLAVSLADGQGYLVPDSFWPNEPSMRRMPGWPIVTAAAIKLSPGVSPHVTARVTGLLINALAAVALAGLTLRLLRQTIPALLTGLAYAANPGALSYADSGLAEPLFILLAVVGTLLIVQQQALQRLSGFLVLGLAVLVRANFILWIVFFGLISVVVLWRTERKDWLPRLCVLAVAGALFLLPPLLWAARNYQLCGKFPVFSALRGQTFYGGNNPVVADDFHYWGFWIFPNSIPGETPMVELARTMSDHEVDAYYYAKGKAYIRSHLAGMPKLWVGKLVRAYVPIPWSHSVGSMVVSLYRLGIYAFLFVGVGAVWRRVGVPYQMALVAMLLTNLATVLVFYGYSRFAFAVEPMYLPFASAGIQRVWRWIGRRALKD